MVYLTKGQNYQTPSGSNAYKLREGSAELFLVPQKNGVFQRPMHLIHLDAGTTIPGLYYTDESYVTWRLQLEATEDCQIQVVENGNTRPLQNRFLERLQINVDDMMSFEQNLIEQYVLDIISEDVFILKSQQARQEERKKSIAVLEQAGRPRKKEADKADKADGPRDTREKRSGGFRARCRSIMKASEGKALALMLLLTLAAGAAGVSLMSCAPGLVHPDSHASWPGAAVVCLCLALYLVLKGLLKRKILAESDRIAEEWQRGQYDKVFCSWDGNKQKREENRETIDLISSFNRVSQGVNLFYRMIADFLVALIVWISLLISSSHSQMLSVTIGLGVFTVICGYLQFKGNRDIREIRKNIGKTWGEAESDLLQFFGNIQKIRLSGAMEHMIRRYYTLAAKSKSLEESAGYIKFNYTKHLQEFIIAVFCVFMAVVILNDHVPVETDVILLIGGILTVYEGIQGFRSMTELFLRTDFPQNLKIELEAPEHEEKYAVKGESAALDAPMIQIEDVSFAYDQTPVLQEISLSVRKGEYLGIAGPSGCGKSTLLRILAGMESPDSGEIYFMGEQITDQARNPVLQKEGMVLQDDQLLHGSIRENILAGTENIDKRTLLEAAEDALLTDDIASMPMGFETLISEQVENVSAGQKQKILLARALVRSPEILFLDEAESDLDGPIQERIYENIRRRVPTAVIVAHHYRSLSKCDRIIVMDQGRVIEEGSPRRLVENRGRFYELMKRQM